MITAAAVAVLALPNLERARPGFVDRLIHGGCLADNKTTVACEKSFRRLPLTEVLP